MEDVVEETKKRATKLYLDSFAHSNILSARMIPQNKNMVIRIELNQRNFESYSSFKLEKNVIINKRLEIVASTTPTNLNNELLVAIAGNGNKALIRRVESNDPNCKQNSYFYLEIWDSDSLEHNIELTSLTIHGNVYNENNFGCLVWSDDDEKLAYIAEAYVGESMQFHYKKKLSESDIKDRGNKFVQSSNWGEVYSSIHDTVVVVYTLSSKSFQVLRLNADNISPAKVAWVPGTYNLVCNGYENKPPRLGLIHCTNRKGAMFCTNESGLHTPICSGKSYSSPRVDPAGKILVWLERDIVKHHHGCFRLMKTNLKSMKTSIIINIVDTVKTIQNGKQFYGIYCLELPARCWSNDGKYVFFSTPKKNVITSYIVHVDTFRIYEIGTGNLSTVILDVHKNFVLATASSLNFPSVLFGAFFRNIDDPLTFKLIHSVKFKMLPDIDVTQYEFLNDNVDPGMFPAMYYGLHVDESYNKIPVIVVPHGGPHSCITDSFSSTFYFFIQMGYGVVIVNFHGSIGIGEKFVTSLLGNIGTVDVQDVQIAIECILKKVPYLDEQNVMIFGGSHGGYLGTMLTAKYPTFYKAVAVRNPVVNIILALWSSDIPDWAVVESGYNYEDITTTMANKKMLEKMLKISPMHLAKSVITPTLLLVGKNDLRVSPHHSYHYYKILQENGVNTKLIQYDDNHSLSTLITEMDNIINSILWFEENFRR